MVGPRKKAQRGTKRASPGRRSAAASRAAKAPSRRADPSTARAVARRALEGGLKLADASEVERLAPYVAQIVRALGHEEAWVSDESMISDFGDGPAELERAARELGVPVRPESYVFRLAESLAKRDRRPRRPGGRPGGRRRGP